MHWVKPRESYLGFVSSFWSKYPHKDFPDLVWVGRLQHSMKTTGVSSWKSQHPLKERIGNSAVGAAVNASDSPTSDL